MRRQPHVAREDPRHNRAFFERPARPFGRQRPRPVPLQRRLLPALAREACHGVPRQLEDSELVRPVIGAYRFLQEDACIALAAHEEGFLRTVVVARAEEERAVLALHHRQLHAAGAGGIVRVQPAVRGGGVPCSISGRQNHLRIGRTFDRDSRVFRLSHGPAFREEHRYAELRQQHLRRQRDRHQHIVFRAAVQQQTPLELGRVVLDAAAFVEGHARLQQRELVPRTEQLDLPGRGGLGGGYVHALHEEVLDAECFAVAVENQLCVVVFQDQILGIGAHGREHQQ